MDTENSAGVALAVWLVLADARLSLAVGAALFTAGIAASGIGLLFPWIFDRLGFINH